jgi:hypothetical protein
VNGVSVGTVNPYGEGSVWVGDSLYGQTILYGQAPGTSLEWGPRVVATQTTDFFWTVE